MKDSSSKTEDGRSLRFAVIAVDVVLFTLKEQKLLVCVVKVDRPPYFKNIDGFPGGLVHADETTEESAKRILNEKANITSRAPYIEQLYTFSRVDRDPRGRVVSVAYLGLIPFEDLTKEEGEGGFGARFVLTHNLEHMAYDHDEVLGVALLRLRSRVAYTTIIQKLLPNEFTLTELEQAYETILGADVDKRNFRKKFAKLDLLEELPHKREGGKHRPARLFRFKSAKVTEVEIL